MINKRIVYEENGVLKVVIPAPEYLLKQSEAYKAEGFSEPEAALMVLNMCAEKSIPSGIPWDIVDKSEVPVDRTFRNAWVKIGKVIDVNMPKARQIHMDRIRAARNIELDKTDKEFVRTFEDGVNLNAVKTKRQKLRDIPQTFDLEQFVTPDTLKAAWPEELKGK